jgi:hypothetical protein
MVRAAGCFASSDRIEYVASKRRDFILTAEKGLASSGLKGFLLCRVDDNVLSYFMMTAFRLLGGADFMPLRRHFSRVSAACF